VDENRCAVDLDQAVSWYRHRYRGRDMLVSCVVLWFWVDSTYVHVKDEVKVHVMRWIQADAYV
jgi:hypothetical protein